MMDEMNNYEYEQNDEQDLEKFETFCELGKYVTGMDDDEFAEGIMSCYEMSNEELLERTNAVRGMLLGTAEYIKDNLKDFDVNNERDRMCKSIFASLIPDLMWVIDVFDKTMNPDGSIKSEEEIAATGLDYDKFFTTFNEVLLKVAMVKKTVEDRMEG